MLGAGREEEMKKRGGGGGRGGGGREADGVRVVAAIDDDSTVTRANKRQRIGVASVPDQDSVILIDSDSD